MPAIRQDSRRTPRADARRRRRLHLGLDTRHPVKLAMVFPGQGSQAVGMMRGYEGLPEVSEILSEAGQVLGNDFLKVLNEGPAETLNLTVNTQPAMVTAGYAAYRAWRALGGPVPQVVAGHRLGGYTGAGDARGAA